MAASMTIWRDLSCGCRVERTLTQHEPVPPGWVHEAARTLAAILHLLALTHKCPNRSPA